MRCCWKIAENISEKILEALAMHRHSTRNYNIFAVCSKLAAPSVGSFKDFSCLTDCISYANLLISRVVLEFPSDQT
jgi:hypothetical protein